jgi:hypothetical protein
MDFNKSFLSYDTVDGALCQTTAMKMTQREAAIEAVEKIGLNMISPINKDWFYSKENREMFFRRLEILQNAIK